LGYTGTESDQERSIATGAVDTVLLEIISSGTNTIRTATISALIAEAMRAVRALPTEDRDRTAGYLLEIWYIVGFRGATGRFAFGKAYPFPEGYGEPLPPGWTSPTTPRQIGNSF